MDLTDVFYNEVIKLLTKYEETVIQKGFVAKPAPLDELSINVSKGQLIAAKQLRGQLETLYKNFKSGLSKE